MIVRSMIFVFTGQGAQSAEMGKNLIDDFSSVRKNIQEMNIMLQAYHIPPLWNLLGMQTLIARLEPR